LNGTLATWVICVVAAQRDQRRCAPHLQGMLRPADWSQGAVASMTAMSLQSSWLLTTAATTGCLLLYRGG
jgi:hypothetical protein